MSNATAPTISFRQPPTPRRNRVVGAGYIYDKRPPGEVHGRTLAEYAIVQLLEGGGWFEDHLGRRAVRQGDVLVLFPGIRHGYWRGASPRWSECWLMFEGPLFAALEDDGVLDRRCSVLSPGIDRALSAEFDALARDVQHGGDLAGDLLTARAHLVLAGIVQRHRTAEHRRRGADFITAACARLEERLDQPIDLERLARGLELPYERFRKLFAQTVGVAPARYRLLRRVDRAKALLAEGRLPLAQIAGRLGYCDVYFFGRQFRQVTGQTPARFRRAFLGGDAPDGGAESG